jgi:hypothetical protein
LPVLEYPSFFICSGAAGGRKAMKEKEPVLWVIDDSTGRIEGRRINSHDWLKDIVFKEKDREKILERLKPGIDENKALEKLLNIIKWYLQERISMISSRPLYYRDVWEKFRKIHLNVLPSLYHFPPLSLRMAFNAFTHTKEQGKEFFDGLDKLREGAQSVIKIYDAVIKPAISRAGKPIKDPEFKKLITGLSEFYKKHSAVPRMNNSKRFFQFIDACVMPIERKLDVNWIYKKKKKTFHGEINRILGVKVTRKK